MNKEIRWLYNYWKTLKQQGLTEKQFIVEFEKYFETLALGENTNCPCQEHHKHDCYFGKRPCDKCKATQCSIKGGKSLKAG